MLAWLTLRKISSLHVIWLVLLCSNAWRSIVFHALEHSRTNQITCIGSQLQQARHHWPASWGSYLPWADSVYYLIGSAVFQRMEYYWTTKVRQKTFYFPLFSVSWDECFAPGLCIKFSIIAFINKDNEVWRMKSWKRQNLHMYLSSCITLIYNESFLIRLPQCKTCICHLNRHRHFVYRGRIFSIYYKQIMIIVYNLLWRICNTAMLLKIIWSYTCRYNYSLTKDTTALFSNRV
jgi:hypothetical protein